MWVNKILFQTILDDNKKLQEAVEFERIGASRMSASTNELRAQKAKDDITIDWMRHRINALEKERTILVQKVAGIALPTPEIVPTRPGTMTVPDFSSMPSFEDVGDTEAQRLGIRHDEYGVAEFVNDMRGQQGRPSSSIEN